MDVDKPASEQSELLPFTGPAADSAQEDDSKTMFDLPAEIIQLIVSYLSLQGEDNWSKQSACPAQAAFLQMEWQEKNLKHSAI